VDKREVTRLPVRLALFGQYPSKLVVSHIAGATSRSEPGNV
jgi:hypothetical protein